ncbi:MAG TPA: thiamine pyrophosphate-dependent enzyme [Gemmatimonadales bacterium]
MSALALRDAVMAVRQARGDGDIVIVTMGAAREWQALGPLHPLDLFFVPSAMGHATSVGLGIALARPARRVIVLNGDGSMLMNLGSLVTITAERPENLVLVLCDNGAYEVTGAQPTPGTPAGRAGGDAVDWVAMARAAGFTAVLRFDDLSSWREGLPGVLTAAGPVFVHLVTQADADAGGPRSPGPAPDRARALRAALSG